MKRNIMTAILLVALTFLVITPTSHAGNIQIDEIIWQQDVTFDPSKLNASVEFSDGTTVGDNVFQMILTNLTLDGIVGDFPATVMLTGIGFNLISNKIDGGNVSPTNLFPQGTISDPSPYWGYDNEPSKGYFKQGEVTTKSVNAVVSTMTAAVENEFFTSFNNGNLIAGPDYGVLSNYYPGTNAYPYFQDSVIIDITLESNIVDWSKFISDVNTSDVVVAFGSPTAVVPEPATMFLFGAGLIGLAGLRRKFRKD